MKDCEEHRYQRWQFIQCPTSNGVKFKEIRSCIECGKSQIRSVDRVEIPTTDDGGDADKDA